MNARLMRKIQRLLNDLAQPHTVSHIVVGREDRIEEALGIKVHVRADPEGWMAWCHTCKACIRCSPIKERVTEEVHAHARQQAYIEFCKMVEDRMWQGGE